MPGKHNTQETEKAPFYASGNIVEYNGMRGRRSAAARSVCGLNKVSMLAQEDPSSPISLSHIVLAQEKAGTNRGSLSPRRQNGAREGRRVGGRVGGWEGRRNGHNKSAFARIVLYRAAVQRHVREKDQWEERRNDFSNKAIIAFDGPNARPPVRH